MFILLDEHVNMYLVSHLTLYYKCQDVPSVPEFILHLSQLIDRVIARVIAMDYIPHSLNT